MVNDIRLAEKPFEGLKSLAAVESDVAGFRILMAQHYPWKEATIPGGKIRYAGDEGSIRAIVAEAFESERPDFRRLKGLLTNSLENFSGVIEGRGWMLAFVDKIRSYPIFYARKGRELCVSNSARLLKAELRLEEVDELSLLEFYMAGYVTGKETIYKDLYQVQAGEVLFWNHSQAGLTRDRYYLFYPGRVRDDKESDLLEDLEEVTNEIFRRVIQKADGAPVWVPLSGGLDSRLVACKLHELGYDRLNAFSYGPPGNYEMKAAKHVAQTLKIPWLFLPSKRREYREFFYSETRKQYWEFSDGACSLPFMQDLDTLLALKKKGKLGDHAILINGQSGDFITGNHIPASLMDKTSSMETLLRAVIEKHYSLWLNLKTEQNLHRVKNKILNLLSLKQEDDVSDRAVHLYELWEWQERQSKYVVNGQRNYDFVNLLWSLPLWDSAYLRFWADIPPEHKYAQGLYKKYLMKYDYKGLFKGFSPPIWRWPGWTISFVPAARVVRLLLGKRAADRFYENMRYFGHYRPHYASYDFRTFRSKAHLIRGHISLDVETWLKENVGDKCRFRPLENEWSPKALNADGSRANR
jgi:asparagine synthase (glutamine-hydrolysing)